MRPLVLILVLLLAACGGRPTSAPRAPAGQMSAQQCYASLDAIDGLSYRPLPPRREGACGFSDGVQLLDIGVPVGGITAMSCPLAATFFRFVHEGLQPVAERHFGQAVVRVDTYGTYACRTRNGVPGARLSEHARANAVDVASFTLADGTRIGVEEGWRAGGATSAFLNDVHRAACRHFQIVIGPDGDRHHQDHIHMDMGRGPYCR